MLGGSDQPHITWVNLHGNGTRMSSSQDLDPPNWVENFSDVAPIVFGFMGRPYTFYDPAATKVLRRFRRWT